MVLGPCSAPDAGRRTVGSGAFDSRARAYSSDQSGCGSAKGAAMKTLIAICGVLLLAACSTMPQRAVPESLFSDAAFGEAPTELQTLDLFALSPAMRDFLLQDAPRSEEHTSELQSLMRISYAVFCLKKKK